MRKPRSGRVEKLTGTSIKIRDAIGMSLHEYCLTACQFRYKKGQIEFTFSDGLVIFWHPFP